MNELDLCMQDEPSIVLQLVDEPCIEISFVDDSVQVCIEPAPVVEFELIDEPVLVLEMGQQGPPGRDGDDGTLTYAAAQALSALRAVWITADGLRYASAADEASCDAVLGISLQAALTDDLCMVRHFGRMSDASWSWTQGDPVFLGVDGVLTQAPDAALPLVELGIAITPQALLVRIQTPFF